MGRSPAISTVIPSREVAQLLRQNVQLLLSRPPIVRSLYSSTRTDMFFTTEVLEHQRSFLPTMQMAAYDRHHLDSVGWTTLAHGVGLHVPVEPLIWVQFRPIAREQKKAQSLFVLGAKASGNRRPVHRMTRDDQIDITCGLLEQAPQKADEGATIKLAAELREGYGPLGW